MDPHFFFELALDRFCRGISRQRCAARGEIPYARVAVFEGLALLDEHFSRAVKDTHVYHQTVVPLGDLRVPFHGLAGFDFVLGI